MVRVLRAKPAGSGSGGTGRIAPAPGATANIREGDATDAAQLDALAAFKAPGAAKVKAAPISKSKPPQQRGSTKSPSRGTINHA